jgi:hypothetical protein
MLEKIALLGFYAFVLVASFIFTDSLIERGLAASLIERGLAASLIERGLAATLLAVYKFFNPYNLFGVILYLAAAGCASLPPTFSRVDGRSLDPKQLSTDQAFCRGEINVNLATGDQTTIWGPTEDAITVYTVCMAQRGYRAAK